MNKTKRNIVLVILSMIAGMVYLTPLLRFSFYDQMMLALQLSDIELGTIGSVYGIACVVGYVPSGFLADRFNTKKLLIISNLGMALTTFWYSTYPGFQSLVIIHALYGFFSIVTFWSPYLKAIRSLGSEKEQGRLFGMSEGIRGVGQTAVAFTCLGAMALFASGDAGLRVLLLINGGVFVLLMLAVIIMVPDIDKEHPALAKPESGTEKNSGLGAFSEALKSSSTWICIFVIFCGYTLWLTVNGYIGTYCTRVLNISHELSSTLSIIRSYLIVFLAGFSGGFVIDRFSTKGKGLILAFALTALGVAAVFATSRLVPLCIAMTIVLAYIVNVIKSTYWSIMGEAGIPAEKTGMATGVISFIAFTPDTFISLIISRFLHYGESLGKVEIGFNLMLLWAAAWAILGVIAAWVLKRRAERRPIAAGLARPTAVLEN